MKKHIFIVQSNEIYSLILDYILSKDSSFKFSCFKLGEECLENLYQNPDIIILDPSLPGMNGYDVLLEIKKYNPDIQVLILSSNRDMKLTMKLLDAGADDFILRQCTGEETIIDKIANLLAAEEIKKSINTKLQKKRVLSFR